MIGNLAVQNRVYNFVKSDCPLRKKNHLFFQWPRVSGQFSDHFSDRFISEFRSNLVICCSANPFGLWNKSDLFTEVPTVYFVSVLTRKKCNHTRNFMESWNWISLARWRSGLGARLEISDEIRLPGAALSGSESEQVLRTMCLRHRGV